MTRKGYGLNPFCMSLTKADSREGREPNGSVAQVLPCYRILHPLEQQLAS